MRRDHSTLPEPAGDVISGECGFRHETLFYRGEDGFLGGTVPFIQDALEAEEPVLVAVGQAKIERLREVLPDGGKAVGFADMRVLGSNPSRIIPAWRAFLQEHAPDGRPVRGIGEPIWAGRSDAELTECQRHESLLNVAFDDGQAWRLLCPYDLDALDDQVIAAARQSHPVIAEHGATRGSDEYLSLEEGWDPFAGALSAPGADCNDYDFTYAELGSLRRCIAGVAADAQLGSERVGDLVLAVNELATNSIQHGGGRGTLRMWREGGTLLCEVSDRGRFTEPLVGRVYPAPQKWSGRGLWLANQLCDLVQVRSAPAGSTVRVHMRVS
jgi:anti-sigma regulatory factor (Ser/Thr protein kinase)